MVELTEFLQNISSGNLATLAKQAAAEPQEITGQQVSPQVAASPSFQQAGSIFQNILSGGELPETFRESVTTQNLLALGQATTQRAQEIQQETAIREQQRAADVLQVGELQKQFEDAQKLISSQLEQLGQSVSQASEAAGQKTGGLNILETIGGPFGLGAIGGAAVVGIALLLLTRR